MKVRYLITFKFRHRVDELLRTNGVVDGIRGAVLEPSRSEPGCGAARGRSLGEFTVRAGRGHHRLPEASAPTTNWCGETGLNGSVTCPRSWSGGVPDHVWTGRMLEISEGGRGVVNQPRPDVALHRRYQELGPDLA